MLSRSVCNNGIGGEAAGNLADIVLQHSSLTNFCGIPLLSLRDNSVTKVDLSNKGVGEPGAIVLSSLLKTNISLRELKCVPIAFCAAR